MDAQDGFVLRGDLNWMTPKAGACGATSKTSGRQIEMATALQSQAAQWLTPHGMGGIDHNGKLGGGGEFAKQVVNWATPNTLDGMQPKTEKAVLKEMTVTRPGRSQMANLRDQVIHNWTTPSASDGTRGGCITENMTGTSLTQKVKSLWSTPKATELERGICTAESNRKSPSIQTQAANWLTPTARDHKGANTEPSLHRSNGQSRMDQLANAAVFSRLAPPTQDGKKLLVERQSSHRQLNPLFASWLMGWPSTWVIAAPHASNALATASWRSALQRHLSCLLSDQEFSS